MDGQLWVTKLAQEGTRPAEAQADPEATTFAKGMNGPGVAQVVRRRAHRCAVTLGTALPRRRCTG